MKRFSLVCLSLVLLLVAGCGSDNNDSLVFVVDKTPKPFDFTDQSNVVVNSTITSNTITVKGINSGSPITIANGEYSINGGAYTALPGKVKRNQTVTVRHTSPATNNTQRITIIDIGGVQDLFTSTTGIPVVAAFTFVDQTGVATDALITSADVAITVTGVNPAAISITGGQYSLNGALYTAADGSVPAGAYTVSVQHTSPLTLNTATNTTLTIGDATDIFTSVTYVDPAVFYVANCTGCHSLDNGLTPVDPTVPGDGPNLSDELFDVTVAFPNPGVATIHPDGVGGTVFILSAAQIAALADYFAAN